MPDIIIISAGRLRQPLVLLAPRFVGLDAIRVELAFGTPRFDSVTDRSVLASMTIARGDLEGSLMEVDHVLDLDPVLVSRRLNERPAMAGRVLHWPAREMLELVARLQACDAPG
jgi:hypothetical protein